MKRVTLLGMILSILFVSCSPSTEIRKTEIQKEAAKPAEDPQIEERMQALAQSLLCLVCQNETLADSRADVAEDLRKEIRKQMKAGKSDQEIIAFLTQRYGDFILYKPTVKATPSRRQTRTQ